MLNERCRNSIFKFEAIYGFLVFKLKTKESIITYHIGKLLKVSSAICKAKDHETNRDNNSCPASNS